MGDRAGGGVELVGASLSGRGTSGVVWSRGGESREIGVWARYRVRERARGVK